MAHVDKDGIITYCYAVRGRPQFSEPLALCCPEVGNKWRKDWDQCVIKEGRQKLAELDGAVVLLGDIMQKKVLYQIIIEIEKFSRQNSHFDPNFLCERKSESCVNKRRTLKKFMLISRKYIQKYVSIILLN